jgi:D-alanyl-D-alanine carboxypeptidase/D-alanyl-D-alanine-endopeptidase (penicillin-binding protein 4)
MIRRHAVWVLNIFVVMAGGLLADPPACLALESKLQARALEIFGDDQGIYFVSEAGSPLVAIEPERALIPASLSKIPATTAILGRLDPDHRFRTRMIYRGGPAAPSSEDMTDDATTESAAVSTASRPGDLVLEASGDPFLVSESLLWIGSEVAARGYGRLDGSLEVRGPLLLNWKPQEDLRATRRLLTRKPSAAQRAATEAIFPGAIKPGPLLAFGGQSFPDAGEVVVLTYISPPLLPILKELNAYSNNVFHDFAEAVGGVGFVQADARQRSPDLPAGEIVIENGAGLSRENRLSARAVVDQIEILEDVLAAHGARLRDVLPVAGVDRGTLADRLGGASVRGAVVGKTGTLPSVEVSALAGVVSTRRFGRITFAILNHGLPVAEARRKQDAFLNLVLREAGARPLAYERPAGRALSLGQIR